MKIFGKEITSHDVLNWWHYAGIGVAVTGGIAAELAPVFGAGTKPAAVVAALGTASLGATTWMNRIAHNKMMLALVNNPDIPTPTSIGIPKPTTEPAIDQKA